MFYLKFDKNTGTILGCINFYDNASNLFEVSKQQYVDFVEGKVNLHINEDCNTYIKGDWNIQVDGNKKEVIKGRYDLDITAENGDGELDIEAKVIHLNKTSQYS